MEEILVDDDNCVTEIPTATIGTIADEQSTQLMPMLYIQQGKLRQSVNTTQTIVPSNATTVATIINPINNQIITGPNKVFIQGSNPVTPLQNTLTKKHIVLHRSVNTASQGPKHILVRKPKTPSAQIMPLNASQASQPHTPQGPQHAFTYVGTLIKPGKGREQGIYPAGAGASKLVISPVISQLGPTSSSSNTVPTLAHKHMANLILPVSHCIPQQGGSNKQNMFNLKINNGQISADGKGTITVLRESKTSNATTHPPPLHPITKLSLLSVAKNTNNNVPDSIKITENPDSAVITPIPKNDIDCEMPEKRKKTISNILRSSGVKRMKKQNLSKCVQDSSMMDIRYTISSPESDQEKEKKKDNDDEITLIKVVPNENHEKLAKVNSPISNDDDCKIEIIKTPTKPEIETIEKLDKSKSLEETKEQNHGSPNDSNFDATKALEWKDGVGSLPGSDLKFAMNEFGLMELVDNDDNKDNKNGSIGDKENVCVTQNSSKSSSASEKKSEDRKTRGPSIDTFYCCEGCGCHGLASEFESPISCSPSCTEIIESKKQLKQRKDKDLNKEIRAKRKRKKMLQDQTKEADKPKDVEKKKDLDLRPTDIDDRSKDSDKSDDKSVDRVKFETDEDTKESNTMDVDSHGEVDAKYPWLTGKSGFSWSKYLEHCKAKPAPVKLFKDPFPYSKNIFKVGMKLEGVDPEHTSQYCVLTVVEVLGYRIRLHFDGYPENYDFWVNADSMDIFPVGWAEKNDHKLNPPKSYVPSNFNWTAYLKTCKATAAPKTGFSNKNSVCPTGFRLGMKLEAVDKKHSSLVCVASIADLMDSRILVHFDSWDDVYDYWADASSPYIHPVGWCQHNGHSLTPPNSFKDSKNFTWDAYLKQTRSLAAPARAFKQRSPCGFKRGMKLEAVDKRVPQLIRVATIEDVKDHMIKIRFDGWPENHAYWVEDDSTDIHPIGWCHKTGHPLEAPLTPDSINERTECGSPGCRGIGHIKGPKYATHNSPSGCPYSGQNLQKSRLISDRLNIKLDFCEFEEDMSEKMKMERIEKVEKVEKIKSDKLEKSLSFEEKFPKLDRDIKMEEVEPMEIDKKLDEPNLHCNMSNSFEASTPVHYAPNMPDKQLRTELYYSVYNPGYNPLPDAPHIWAKHSNALNRVVARQNTNPRRWSNEEVIKFIQSVPNCKEIGTVFRQHNIDGEAFLMLTQEDLVTLLGLRLGPAIKLYNSIVLLRRRAT